MRVVQLIDAFAVGGAERLLPVLCPALRQEGIEVACLALSARPRPNVQDLLEEAGVSTRVIGVRGLSRRSLEQVVAALRESRPHLVHAHLTHASILGALASSWLGLPSLVTLHQLGAMKARQPREAARECFFRLVVGRFASRVIGVSAAVADYYRRRGVPVRKLRVVHNAIDAAPFRPPLAAAERVRRLAELGFAADARILVTVAVLRPGKGIGALLRALPLIVEREPRVVLLVVGDGPTRQRLEQRAAVLGLGRQVRFLGQRDDVATLLRLAEVFVLPTRYEAFPTVLLEALAAGLPAVASRVGGVPEIVSDGREALLRPAADAPALAAAVVALLADDALRGRMGEAAAARAEHFSPHLWGRQLAELYVEQFSGRRQRGVSLAVGR